LARSAAAAAVTANSHITVTLTGNPGTPDSSQANPNARPPTVPIAVQWAERDAGTGFTLHLTSPTVNAVNFTYLIAEPTAA
jgi:hypothetical protein